MPKVKTPYQQMMEEAGAEVPGKKITPELSEESINVVPGVASDEAKIKAEVNEVPRKTKPVIEAAKPTLQPLNNTFPSSTSVYVQNLRTGAVVELSHKQGMQLVRNHPKQFKLA